MLGVTFGWDLFGKPKSGILVMSRPTNMLLVEFCKKIWYNPSIGIGPHDVGYKQVEFGVNMLIFTFMHWKLCKQTGETETDRHLIRH